MTGGMNRRMARRKHEPETTPSTIPKLTDEELQLMEGSLRGRIPELVDFNPSDDQIYFIYENEVVRFRTEKFLNYDHTRFSTFYINKNHYKAKMPDVVHHINYFLAYYDIDKELFMAITSMKYIVDMKPNLKQKAFKELLIERVITDNFVKNVKQMAYDLYQININTDDDDKYKTTPKINNNHARLIVAISFCIRFILPICIHYSNVNNNIVANKAYIDCFNDIYMEVIKIFQCKDCDIYSTLCRFAKYRVDRSFIADKTIWEKKKQLYGITQESVLHNLIHEIIIVKGLYKLAYNRSVVSFIDGLITNTLVHARHENFKYKPIEIEADDGGDSDDYLSQVESLEMLVYRIDESNIIINEVNTDLVMQEIREKFNIDIPQDEFDFYFDNIKINPMTQLLTHTFYSRYFKYTNAIYSLNRSQTVLLLIYMKKFLQLKGMYLLPQLCTAQIRGKFKDNIIKNTKFVEKFSTSSVYQNIIQSKFRYIMELNPKEDPIIKKLSTIINSTFELVDYNPDINGIIYSDLNVDLIITEFLLFLTII